MGRLLFAFLLGVAACVAQTNVINGWGGLTGPVVNTVNGNSGPVTLTTANLLSTYTWAAGANQIPACTASLKNIIAYVSDVGDLGSNWVCVYSNHEAAYQWRPIGGRVMLAASMIPFILPSSGTIANNGALTLTTALPRTYASGAYLYFPAGAMASGSAAGLYWTVMSSTTTGTIYNNTYSSGLPSAPASPTAFVTTGPGAYTQTTGSYVTLASISVAGGLMGQRGELWATGTWNSAATANTKTAGLLWGGAANLTFQIASGSNPAWQSQFILRSAESTGLQEAVTGWNGYGGAGTIGTYVFNTANATTLAQEAKLATATDFVVEETWEIELARP